MASKHSHPAAPAPRGPFLPMEAAPLLQLLYGQQQQLIFLLERACHSLTAIEQALHPTAPPEGSPANRVGRGTPPDRDLSSRS